MSVGDPEIDAVDQADLVAFVAAFVLDGADLAAPRPHIIGADVMRSGEPLQFLEVVGKRSFILLEEIVLSTATVANVQNLTGV